MLLQLTVILLACNNTRPHVHWKTNTHKVLQLTVTALNSL